MEPNEKSNVAKERSPAAQQEIALFKTPASLSLFRGVASYFTYFTYFT